MVQLHRISPERTFERPGSTTPYPHHHGADSENPAAYGPGAPRLSPGRTIGHGTSALPSERSPHRAPSADDAATGVGRQLRSHPGPDAAGRWKDDHGEPASVRVGF